MLGNVDIRDYADLVDLSLASVYCNDELMEILHEIKDGKSYGSDKKRTGLKCIRDSFDYLTGKRIFENLGDLAFVSYQEGVVLRNFFRDKGEYYDAGMENLSLSLERVLDEEMSKEKRIKDSEKMIKFFCEIGSMCNSYAENPPLELLRGYIPTGLFLRAEK